MMTSKQCFETVLMDEAPTSMPVQTLYYGAGVHLRGLARKAHSKGMKLGLVFFDENSPSRYVLASTETLGMTRVDESTRSDLRKHCPSCQQLAGFLDEAYKMLDRKEKGEK